MSEPTTFDPPAPGQLAIEVKRDAESIVVSLTGELDLATVEAFDRTLREAEAASPARLVVDLGRLAFMDSTGLQTLLRAAERAHSSEYQLALRRGPNQVQRVFELTRTVEAFRFAD
ncbi:MAG: STAS domain-containing protein [Actinomycetota bacterium]|nr:STAS domain-containing protein [Actinomycetota bacterium]